MSSELGPHSLKAFESTAVVAAAYLDACDAGITHIHLDPDHYRDCATLLSRMFALFDPAHHFPTLLEHSPAAREIAEGIVMGGRLDTSCLIYYPQLAAFLGRVATRNYPV